MKVFVDTNVLLDVGQQRTDFLADGNALIKWCAAHPGNCFIAWHSISNVYYTMSLKKNGGSPETARDFIAILLDIFEIPAAATAAAKSAFRMPMKDFEDALQVASATEAGADVIVTRDKPDYKNSMIPIQTPQEFLATVVL